MEGSVQRSGNRVRVTAQLIDARSDTQEWAERYDRDLADVFAIQSEIAKTIADQLKAKLSPQEKASVEEIPTANTEAYVYYLRANQIERNPDTLLEDYKIAEGLFAQAIELDPNFALAHARLASIQAEIFHYYEPTETRRMQSPYGSPNCFTAPAKSCRSALRARPVHLLDGSGLRARSRTI